MLRSISWQTTQKRLLPVYERAVSQQGLLLSPKIASDNVFYMLPAGKIINFVRNKNGKETVIQVYP